MRPRMQALITLLALLTTVASRDVSAADARAPGDLWPGEGAWSGSATTAFELRDARREDGRASGVARDAGSLRLELGGAPQFATRFSLRVRGELERGSSPDAAVVAADDPSASCEHVRDAQWLELAIAARLSPHAGLEAGRIRVPIGVESLDRSPRASPLAIAPDLETRVIPGSWSALGVAFVFSPPGGLRTQLAVVEGLDGSRFDAVSAIRPGRPGDRLLPPARPAIAARIDWDRGGPWTLGGSAFAGRAWSRPATSNDLSRLRATLAEGHAGIRTRRLRLAAIYAMGTIAPHESLDVALGLDGSSEAVGRRFFGGAVQASLLPFTRSRSKWARSLEPFARFDETDTQDGVGAAGTENPAHHWTTLGVGVRGRPLESVFLTLEREQRGNESHTAIGRWEAALAIAFDGPATPRRAGER